MNTTVGARLKELRKMLKYSQEDFAKEIGVSRTHISNLENGNDTPSTTLIKLICIKFHINEEWLADGEGFPYPDYSMATDEGTISKYNDMRVSFEQMLRKRTGTDLANTVKAFSYLVGMLSASKLDDEDTTKFLECVRLVIDDFEKLTFKVSSGIIPSKRDAHSWLEYKNVCMAHIERINKNIKNAVNLHLGKHGEEMKL